MKGCKKLLALAFALSMLIGAILLFSFTASAATSGNYTYTVSNGEATITGCSTSISGDVAIPSTLGGYPVTRIGSEAFYNCSGLTSVTIPDSVTSIGEYAFSDCSGLTSLTIPDSVTSIGRSAFGGCSGLTSISLPFVGDKPHAETDAYQYPFGYIFGTSSYSGGTATKQYYYGSSTSSTTSSTYYIPSSLKNVAITGSSNIPRGAFYNCCELTSITIPDSVTSIGDYAFHNCTGLTSVTIGNGVNRIAYHAFYNTAYYNDAKNWDSGVLYIGNYLIEAKGISGEYAVKSGTRLIADKAFYDRSGLTSVTIPDSVVSIGDYAFYGCSGLTSVTIPGSVTSIGNSAFSGCSGLTAISLPFVGDKPHTASDLYQYPFGYIFGTSSYTGGTATTQYYYGNSTSSTTYTTYYIPSTLKSVTITGSSYIPYGAFYDCSGLMSVTIPDGVTSIGRSAFSDCSGLTSVTIPDSVTSIGDYAFSRCTGLTSVTIGSGVTSIGSEAFKNCSSLTTLRLDCPRISNWFSGIKTITSLTIGSGVMEIGNSAFSGCSGLTSVTIPNSVTSIGDYAFRNCYRLTSVTIPNSVTSIGSYAFEYCSGLTSVTIGGGVTSIGNSAFSGCTRLTSVTIGSGVTSIGYRAFFECTGLTSVTIPDSVTSIGNYAFNGCTGLTSITIPDSVTSVGDYAFSGCSGLTSVTIPNSVTSIGVSAFSGCSGLTSVTIGSGVTSIGEGAFSDCSGLTSLTIPDSVTSIGGGAFSGCSGLTSISLPFVGNKPHTASDLYQYPFGYMFGTSSYTGGTVRTQYYYGSSTSSTTSMTYYIPSALKSVTITGSSYIPYGAFYNCTGLTSVTIPDSVTSIGGSAFYNCTELTEITIPDSVTSIGSSAFYNCSGKRYRFLGDAPTLGTNAFNSDAALCHYGGTGWTHPTYHGYKCIDLLDQCDASQLDGSNRNFQGVLFTLGNGTAVVGNNSDNTDNAGFSIYYDLVIPEKVIDQEGNTYTVIGIGKNAFNNNRFVETVNLPKTLRSIGEDAFLGCICLKSFSVDSASTSFSSDEAGVLYNKSKTQLLCYPGASKIEAYSVAPTVNSIKAGSFNGVRYLKELTIPFVGNYLRETASENTLFGAIFGTVAYTGGVSSVQYYATSSSKTFYIPASLQKVTVTGGKVNYGAFYGCGNLHEIILENAITSVGEKAFYNCSAMENLVISENVTSVPGGVLYGCGNLKSLTMPVLGTNGNSSGVLGYIFGSSSFSGGVSTQQYYASSSSSTYYIPASLKTVTITKGNIYYGMFYGCENIESITLPAGAAINERSFYYCTSLKEVNCPSGFSNIPDHAFYNCRQIDGVLISDKCTEIGQSAFVNCYKLNALAIPAGCTEIGYGAFANCQSLKAVNIPGGVTEIKPSTFSRCSALTEIIIPANVSSIGSGAFSECNELTEVDIPDSVKTIESHAFASCEKLNSVSIGRNVELIMVGAFDTCPHLSRIVFNAKECVTPLTANVFSGSGSASAEGLHAIVGKSVKQIPIYFFNGSCLTSIEFEKGINLTSIGEYAFSGCKQLTAISIPGSVTFLRKGAFSNCISLREIEIPDSVTDLANSIFSGCTSLESVTLPVDLQTVANYAFYGCAALTELDFPATVTSIGGNALQGCSKLQKLTVPFVGGSPTQNTYLGYLFGASSYSYNGNNVPASLTDLIILDGLAKIDSNAFNGCSTLVHVTIPDSVTEIGANAFLNCASLTDIRISDRITVLGSEAFKGCIGAETMYLGKSVNTLDVLDLPNCHRLKAINVSEKNETYTSDSSGVLYDKAQTTLICYPQARSWPYYNVSTATTTISAGAFLNNANLINVLVPKTVTSIANGNFSGCSSISLLVYNDSAALTYAINNGISYEIADYMSLNGIAIQSLPLSTTYIQGSEFDFEGLYVVANYDIGDLQLNDYTLTYDKDTLGPQTVTVSYLDYTATFEITVVAPSITRIEVTPPSQTEYIEGVALNLTDMLVKAFWDNGNETFIPLDSVSVIGDTDSIGSYRILIVYMDAADREFSDSFRITVLPKTPISLEIQALPDKTVYELSDLLDLSGMIVYVCFDNGTAENVTDYSVSGFDNATVGKQTLTVSYGDFSGTFTVTVEKRTNHDTPAAPVIEEITSSSVTLKAVNGYEYSVDGKTWQDENVFENLEPHKEYSFYQRIKETDEFKPSAASSALSAVTKYPLTGYITVSGRLLEGQVLTAKSENITPFGATVSYQWYRDGIAIEGEVDTAYTVTAIDLTASLTIEAVGTGDYYGTLVGYAPPKVPSLEEQTANTVTLVAAEGLEYSCDGEVWQASNVFENLTPNTTYTFYQRVAGTAECPASEISEAMTVTTEKCTISGTVSISGSASVGSTLTADVSGVLPNDAELSYQWYRDGAAIDGATASTYTSAAEDVEKSITVAVAGINAYIGSLESEPVMITIPVTGVTMEKTAVTIKTGETITLVFTVAPSTATNKDVVWSTSGEGFVSVEDGVVTGLKKGTESVTVTTVDGGFTATCVVTVECAHSASHSVPAEASTCHTHGHEAYTVCDVCGEIIEGSNAELPFTEHQNLETRNAKEATCYETGYTGDVYCNDCNTLISSGTVIKMLDHTPGEALEENRVEPNCTEAGGYDEVIYCSVCSAELNREHKEIPATGHDWTEPTYSWSTDNSEVTASRVCKNDGSHIETETVNTTSEVTKKATCTEPGDTTYTAVFQNAAFAKQTKTVTNIAALGHALGTPVKENETVPTCTEVGGYDTVVYCVVCGTELSRDHTEIKATGHDWNEPTYTWSDDNAAVTATRVCRNDKSHVETETVSTTVEIVEAGCTSSGNKTYTASFKNLAFEMQTKTVAIDPAGHHASEAVRENEAAPTCTETGSYDEAVYCSVCGAELSRETKTIDALGHDLVHHDAQAATCTDIGWAAYDTCTRCDYTTYNEISALGHDLLDHAAQEATCTENGWAAYQTCSRCDYTTYVEIPATGHTPAAAVRENEVAPTCTETGSYDEVVYCSDCGVELSREKKTLDALGHDLVTDPAVAATCTATGLTEGKHCTRCDYKIAQEVVPMAAHSYKDGKCTVCGAKDPDYKPPVTTNPFNDVKEGEFYYEAVLWAVNADPQVTSGTSATTFSPNPTCTRAQVVTFLWRAKGCPEPKTNNNPFIDVKAGDYYYKAVLWAVENGITAGTSATTFSPNAGCTRAQVVTFLWRTEGQPKPNSSSNPFKDVKGGYYYDAVLWAVEKGITAGTSATTFSPDATCTRGQIVTFLYRAFAV